MNAERPPSRGVGTHPSERPPSRSRGEGGGGRGGGGALGGLPGPEGHGFEPPINEFEFDARASFELDGGGGSSSSSGMGRARRLTRNRDKLETDPMLSGYSPLLGEHRRKRNSAKMNHSASFSTFEMMHAEINGTDPPGFEFDRGPSSKHKEERRKSKRESKRDSNPDYKGFRLSTEGMFNLSSSPTGRHESGPGGGFRNSKFEDRMRKTCTNADEFSRDPGEGFGTSDFDRKINFDEETLGSREQFGCPSDEMMRRTLTHEMAGNLFKTIGKSRDKKKKREGNSHSPNDDYPSLVRRPGSRGGDLRRTSAELKASPEPFGNYGARPESRGRPASRGGMNLDFLDEGPPPMQQQGPIRLPSLGQHRRRGRHHGVMLPSMASAPTLHPMVA